MVTPFGKQLRIIRIEHNEILKNMADRLCVSPAFLSSVENGKRNIPAKWIEIITKSYNLSDDESIALERLARESTTSIKVDLTGLSDNKRKAALVFAREFKGMGDDAIKDFLELVNRGKG